MTTRQPPAGFAPVLRSSPYLDLLGVLHVDQTDLRAPVFGLRLMDRHTNSRGTVHGGVLSTVADVALGYGALAAHGQSLALVTVSLTVDFVGTARPGDWLEGRTSLTRLGSRLAFATCQLTVDNGRPVASCRAVFSVPAAASPPANNLDQERSGR